MALNDQNASVGFNSTRSLSVLLFLLYLIAYDRIPREVVRWALRDAGVDEWLVDTVMSTYKGARTVVLTDDG